MIYQEPTINIMVQEKGVFKVVKYNDGEALRSSELVKGEDRMREYLANQAPEFKVISEPEESYTGLNRQELSDLTTPN